MMTYESVLARINRKLRFGIKPGLERIHALLARLGNPERNLKIIHVAGTNGKGSCCALLSSALIAAGQKTGLFISPYVLDFRERFQINGKMISKEELVQVAEPVFKAADAIEGEFGSATEFECITAMAFLWYDQQACDLVVLEVGLGGRLDTTNAIPPPLVSVIMSVSFDHMAILGNTLESIAAEKAGIIKPGAQVVLYPEQDPIVHKVIEKTCMQQHAKLVTPDVEQIDLLAASLSGSSFRYHEVELTTPFAGRHQILNAITAYSALRLLKEKGIFLSDEQIAAGFAAAAMPARIEALSLAPLVIVDGGHNPGCASALKATLDAYAAGEPLIAIMGMMADKDIKAAMELLASRFEKIITVAPDLPRAMSAKEMANQARPYCKTVEIADSIKTAISSAMVAVRRGYGLVVTGSLFLASEILVPLRQALSQPQD